MDKSLCYPFVIRNNYLSNRIVFCVFKHTHVVTKYPFKTNITNARNYFCVSPWCLFILKFWSSDKPFIHPCEWFLFKWKRAWKSAWPKTFWWLLHNNKNHLHKNCLHRCLYRAFIRTDICVYFTSSCYVCFKCYIVWHVLNLKIYLL